MMEGFGLQADKALLDTVFDGVVVVDLNHLRISLANKAAADILGFDDPEDLVGVDPLKHVSPKDRKRATTVLRGLASGSCLQAGAEIKVLDKKGKEVWIMARGVKMGSNGDSVLLASFRDVTAEKVAALALREAEERQVQLLNSSNELILISQEWKVVFANRRLQEAMGVSEEALIGMSILDLTHPDDRKAVARHYQKMLDGKSRPSDRAFRGIGKNGKTSWGMMRHVPYTWQGEPALMTVIQDITRQKLAEEALQESERRYRLITENIRDVVWALDMDLNTIYVSPSVMHQKGYTVEEAMGLSLEQQMTPETLARLKDAIAEEMMLEKTGNADPHRSRTAEGETYRKDGSRLWVEITASFLRDQQGKPIGIMGVTRDITERKRAEEALVRIGKAVEGTSDAVGMSDARGHHFYQNRAFTELFEYTAEELEAAGGGSAAYADRDVAREVFSTIMDGGAWSGEVEMVSKSGRRFPVLLLADAIKDESGAVVGLVGVHRDITRQKEAQEALRASEERFRAIFEGSPIAAIVYDPAGAPVEVNRACLEVFAVSRDDVMKGPALFDDPNLTDNAKRRLRAGQALTREVQVDLDELVRRGSYGIGRKGVAHIRFMVTPLGFGREGEPSGYLALVEDITERKAAEQALKESEEKFKALVENAAAVVFSLDTLGDISYISPAIERLSGFKAGEVIGTSCMQYVVPEDVPGLMTSMEKTAAGELESHEFRVKHKDGSVHHVLTSSRPIHRDGKLAGLIGVMVDVTERNTAEEAQAASEHRYRLLAENASDIIWVTDASLKITYVSPSAVALLGYSVEEVTDRSIDRLITPASLALVTEVYRDDLAREEKTAGSMGERTLEIEVVRKDGSPVWLEAAVRVNRDVAGRFCGFQGACRNISKRKQVEEALRDSEAVYKRLFDNTQTAMEVISGETGLVTLANETAARMFGFDSAADLIGVDSMEYVLPEERDRIAGEMARALAENDKSGATELSVRTRDGRWLWINALVTYTEYRGKKDLLISLIDLTSRKQAEETLQESEEKNRLLIDNAGEAIIVLQDGVLKFANPMSSELSGYANEELISRPFLDIVYPDDRQAIGSNYSKRLAGEDVPNNYRFRMLDKAGEVKWLQINTVRFSWEGRPAILAMLTDVTARKKAEEALQQSEERFRALIEGARDAIAVIDSTGKVIYSSPSARRMANGYLDGMMTTGLRERVHADDAERVTRTFESLLNSPDGTVVDIELRYRRDDGSWGVVEATGTSRLHDPKIGGIVINYRDITERRQAEEALRESESRYRMLAENVSDVIWSLNMRTKQVLLSPSVTRLLGYTPEEAQTMRMKEVVSPTSFSRAMTSFSRLVGRKDNGPNGRSSSIQVEIELMRKDGSFVWVDMSITLLRDAKGEPAEMFGVMRDVTHRKKVEEDLRTSEEYFRALIENAWDAIAIVNGEGTMLYESPSSARILGYEPEEIVGKNLAQFVRPEDIAAIAATFRRFRTEPGSIVMVDAGFRHKDGHYVECEGTLQNFLHDPKINGVVANYRDVTDRRRAEEAIRSSEERFRNLVEATSDWVWEVDPNGVYTYVSPNVREVMGYDVGEVIGRSISDFMPAREAARFSRIFRGHAAKRQPFTFVESSRLHKDGRIVIMETSGVPFFSEDGSLLGYRGIGRDITSRKKVEKDLENSLKKVEKTMEAAIQAISYTMETRDPYTTGHQRRVTQLACAIAKEMGIAPWQIDGIRVAGLLHDIGKIAVPTEILSKPGKLSDIEFSMIKAHPKVGFDILKNVEFEWPIARIVVQHHERLDGSGYPFGLRGRDILQESRILAVADVVEAMSSHRPYRPALGTDKALAEVVRGEGALYDPDVVRACARVIRERGFKFEA